MKNLPANAGDMGWIPGSGRSPGEGHGNTLQYSCLENPMDGGAWWGCKESDMTEQLLIVLISIAHDFGRRKKIIKGFPGGPVVGTQPCNARDTGLIPGQGRSHMLWSN